MITLFDLAKEHLTIEELEAILEEKEEATASSNDRI